MTGTADDAAWDFAAMEEAHWDLLRERAPLLPHHIEFLKARGITAETADGRGYRSIGSPYELKSLGFVKDLCTDEHVPGLLIPLKDISGETWGYPVPARQSTTQCAWWGDQVRVAESSARRAQRVGLPTQKRRDDRRPEGAEMDHRVTDQG